MREWLLVNRNDKGYSQKDVADLVGISQVSYCLIEKGKRNPKVKTAKKIAEVLGFEWQKFF